MLHRGNEFVLRREPVAAAAVDGLPLFAWKCTEQAQQQAPEYGVDGVHAAPFPAADKRVLSDKRLQSCPSIRAAAEIRLRQGELLQRAECEKHVPHVRGEWAIKLFFQKGGHISGGSSFSEYCGEDKEEDCGEGRVKERAKAGREKAPCCA